MGAGAGELGDAAVHEFIEAFRFIAHNGAIAGRAGPAEPHASRRSRRSRSRAIGVAISVAIALPLGVWLGHIHRGSFVAINVGNIGRALPSLVVLAIGDAFLGLGLTVVELALVILAVPPIVTNAYLGVDGVDRDLVDAARGHGHERRARSSRRVELPLAVPLLFAGMRTAAVFVVSTTTIASLAGFSGSLGDVIANETSYHFSGVLGAAICVAALALAVDGALDARRSARSRRAALRWRRGASARATLRRARARLA